MVSINIGCGTKTIPGYLGADLKLTPNCDVVLDVEAPNLPFRDNSVDRIFTAHVLEHINKLQHVMEQFHRVLTPGGAIEIRVPHYSSVYSWSDPTHVRVFTSLSFDGFCSGGTQHYLNRYFVMKNKRIYFTMVSENTRHWSIQMGWALISLINTLANVNIFFCERVWCQWLGGFEEIHFTLLNNAEVD